MLENCCVNCEYLDFITYCEDYEYCTCRHEMSVNYSCDIVVSRIYHVYCGYWQQRTAKREFEMYEKWANKNEK